MWGVRFTQSEGQRRSFNTLSAHMSGCKVRPRLAERRREHMKHTTRHRTRAIAATATALALLGLAVTASTANAGSVPPVTISSGSAPLGIDGPAIDSVSADYYDDAGNFIASTPESDSPSDNGFTSSDSPDPGDSLTELPDPEGMVASQLLTDDGPAFIADIQNTACSAGKTCGTPTYSGTVTWHVWHTQYADDGYTILYRYNLDVHYSYKARKINTTSLWVHSYMTKEDPVVNDLGDDESWNQYYEYWNGVSNSGHASKYKRHLEYCVGGPVGCYENKYPWIHEYVHGDGTMYFHTGG